MNLFSQKRQACEKKIERGFLKKKYFFSQKITSLQDFNYTWFCRVVAPEYEDWHAIDDEEFPVYDPLKARGVPRPKDAILINAPPGLYTICASISKPNNVYLVQKKLFTYFH